MLYDIENICKEMKESCAFYENRNYFWKFYVEKFY